jgi:DNA-binding response OmpR family regulator
MVSVRMLSAAEDVPFLHKTFTPAVLRARLRELLRSVAAAATA